MKLLTIMVAAFTWLASAGAFAQAGSQPASDPAQNVSLQGSQTIKVTRGSSQPSTPAPAEHFTGSARIEPLFSANIPSGASASSVTFEPGARTAWHRHPLGQTLIVTAGKGSVQQWGALSRKFSRAMSFRFPRM